MTRDLNVDQLIAMTTDTAGVTAFKCVCLLVCEIERFGGEDCITNKHITKLRE